MSDGQPLDRRQVFAVLLIAGLLITTILFFRPAADRPPPHSGNGAPTPASKANGDSVAMTGAELQRSGAAIESEEEADQRIAREYGVVRGVIAFSQVATEAPANESIDIITSVPVYLPDAQDPGRPNLLVAPVSRFPLGESGHFLFWLPQSVNEVRVSALGHGCIAKNDVAAAPQDSITIDIVFFYACDVQLIDSSSRLPIDVSEELSVIPMGTTWDYEDPCSTGLRSDLVRPLVVAAMGTKSEAHCTRHLVWTEELRQSGVGLTFVANEVGYKYLVAGLQIPPFEEKPYVIAVPLERESDNFNSLLLTIAREGDWSAVSGAEYINIGQLLIASEADPDKKVKAEACLRPGRQLIRGIAFSDPTVDFEVASYMTLSIKDLALQRLSLNPPEAVGMPFTATLECSNICAVSVPPLKRPLDEKAWLGLRSADQPKDRVGFSYEAASGLIIDGLLPGRYDVFWGESRAKYKASMAANLPQANIELRPGLNPIALP